MNALRLLTVLAVLPCLPLAASGDVTADPIYDFRASNNPGEPGSWTNLGSLGGSLGVVGNQPAVTPGTPAYYGVQGAAGSFDMLSGGSDVNIENGFSYEMYLRRTGGDFGGGEHQLSAIAEGGGKKIFAALDQWGSTDDTAIDVFLYSSASVDAEYGQPDLVPLPENEWTHFILTVDDATDTGKVYINGGAPTTLDLSGVEFTSDAANDVTLFKVRGGEGDGRRFNGDISVARLYDYVLTDQQAMANFQATIPEPSSLGLAGLALLSLTLWGWRRRRY